MKIVEDILELIDEIAFRSRDVESKTTGLWYQILSHLTKLYLFQRDKEKHIKDIIAWAREIMRLIRKCKSSISYAKLAKWHNTDNISQDIKDEIVFWKSEYEIEPVMSDDEVLQRVRARMLELLGIMYKGDIEDLIQFKKSLQEELL